jgi:SAM-dependent methyltransferase
MFFIYLFLVFYLFILSIIFINRVLCNEAYNKYINIGYFYYLFCKDVELKLFLDNMTYILDKDVIILDFGCGPGIISEFFGNGYVGIDIDETRIIQAKKMYPTKNFLHIMPNQKFLPFDDNTFEYILFNDCLHHISNSIIKNIIPELQRILKKDGQIILREPKRDTNMATYFITEVCENGDYVRTTLEYKHLFSNFEIVFEKSYNHYIRDYIVLIFENNKKRNLQKSLEIESDKIHSERIIINVFIQCFCFYPLFIFSLYLGYHIFILCINFYKFIS